MHRTYTLLTGENRLLLDSIAEWNQQQLVFKGVLYQQNHVDQNFAMTQQFTTVPSALIDDWVYFSCLSSVGCTNKSAQIIPAVCLPSYISIHSNGDRAVSVTASKIIIIIITIRPPCWRFGWGVAIVTWKEISAWGLERRRFWWVNQKSVYTRFSFHHFHQISWIARQTNVDWRNTGFQQKKLQEVDGLLGGNLAKLQDNNSWAMGPPLPTCQTSSTRVGYVFHKLWVAVQMQTIQILTKVPGNVGGKGAQLALFCFALKSIKT